MSNAILDALKAARESMTNNRYRKPRIGMEDSCAKVDAAIEALRTFAPPGIDAATFAACRHAVLGINLGEKSNGR